MGKKLTKAKTTKEKKKEKVDAKNAEMEEIKAAGKEKGISLLIDAIDKQFGKGSFRALGDSTVIDVPVIPTGSIKLDDALGIGGLPRGRIVEVYGPEASGKTTLTLQVIAKAQGLGGLAAFIDAEHALDTKYARNLGINVDDLFVSQPDYGEQALEIAELVTRSGAFDIIVIDSVAALTPRAEIEGEMGDSHMGLQARMMSQAMRKLTSCVAKSNTCVVFINQIRHKIGVMFGSPETTTGGNALKFYSSVRLDIRRTGPVKRGDDIIGNTVKVKVAKNKLAPPFREVTSEIIFGKGFNSEGELLDMGILHGVVDKAGSWYSYNEERIGQGKVNVCQFLEDHPDIFENILADIKIAKMEEASADE